MAAEFFTALLIAFGLVFVAELGDKTQLVVLSLATKGHSRNWLAAGAVTGFAVIVALGGVLAAIITRFLELAWISLASGIVFLVMGIFQVINRLRKKEEDGAEESEQEVGERSQNSFLAGFLAIFTMELGDKTQIMTIVLAATSASFVGTLVGAWLALSSLAVVGAFAGEFISKKIPEDKMEIITSILFIAIGVLVVVLALVELV